MTAPDPSGNEVATPYIRMWIDEQIMYCKYADDLMLSLDIARSCVEARIHFSRGKSYPVVVDMRGLKSATREAREYLATIGVTLVKAGALITGSKFNMALGNLFLTIDKPQVPTRLFTSEEKARQWAKAHLQVL